MKRSVSETAKLLGISVRTLHYYDEIGLLKPSEVSAAGYRFYDDDALRDAQQIVFYREIGLSLDEIGRILHSANHDKERALQNHRELLQLKMEHLQGLLALVDETLGGNRMNPQKITAADIEAAKTKYAEEARERWGHTDAYKESEKRQAAYTAKDEQQIAEQTDEIFSAFAAMRSQSPQSEEAQALVARWQAFISEPVFQGNSRIAWPNVRRR